MDAEHPAPIRTVAIIGLGLIGGSLARDLAARGVRILGWDREFASFQGAFATGAANDMVTVGPDAPVAADVVVIAVPVLAAAQVLRSLAPHLDGVRLVTDVGSTKGSIVRAAEELGIGARFVGAHPLAGDHRSGWDASRAGLFDGARVFLTPAPSAEDDALHLATELWTMVDARPEVMDAADHDLLLAWTSHLPQAVSTALALTIAQTGMQRAMMGPGGRDVARLELRPLDDIMDRVAGRLDQRGQDGLRHQAAGHAQTGRHNPAARERQVAAQDQPLHRAKHRAGVVQRHRQPRVAGRPEMLMGVNLHVDGPALSVYRNLTLCAQTVDAKLNHITRFQIDWWIEPEADSCRRSGYGVPLASNTSSYGKPSTRKLSR